MSPKVGLRTVRYRAIIRRPMTRFHVEDNAETQPASVQQSKAGPAEARSPGEPLPPFPRSKRQHRVFYGKVVGLVYRGKKPTSHTYIIGNPKSVDYVEGRLYRGSFQSREDCI